MKTVGLLRYNAGLKLVFCKFINKGWKVGWAGVGGMSPLEGLGLVLKKINFVEGEYKLHI